MSGSCQKINLRTWPRRDIFSFFSSLDQPFYNVCFRVDVTQLHAYTKWICTLTVAFIYESYSWNMVAFELAVNCDRLRLNTCNSAKNKDCSVKNTE